MLQESSNNALGAMQASERQEGGCAVGTQKALVPFDGSRSAGTTSPEAGLGRVRRFATPPALPLHHLARNYLLVRRCASLTYFALILSFVRLSHSRASRQQKSRQRVRL